MRHHTSTATTKRAREQARGLFGRELAVFPPPVLDIEDTFFSRQVPVTPATPGRRYLGICAHGVRLRSAEIRLAEILLIVGQTLFDTYGNPAEPCMTIVGYFNSTRELTPPASWPACAGYLDDDVATRSARRARSTGSSPALACLRSRELTSRISSADIRSVLKRLEVGFAEDLDTSARRKAIIQEYAATRKDKRDLQVGRAGLEPATGRL